MSGRPCTCEKPDCRDCRLWQTSRHFRALWGGDPVRMDTRPCPKCPGGVALKTAAEVVPGLTDPITDPPLSAAWAHNERVKARHVAAFRWLLRQDIPPPAVAEGDGIVILGGGRYWPMATVSARMCRDVCGLPIQLWHRGAGDPVRPGDVADLPGVTIHDATAFPSRVPGAWEAKSVALLNCGLRRVLFLDADAYPVADPTPLLDLASRHRFAFWSDLPNTVNNVRWEAFGLAGDNGVPPVQGGQLAIDLVTFRREMVLSFWLGQHSDYAYRFMFGDQDAYRVALSATGGECHHAGRAPWQHPAFVLPLGGRPVIVHRPQAKLFAYPHLPGEAKAWEYFARVIRP